MGEPVCPSGDGSASDPDRFARIVERSEPGLRRFLGRLGLRGCDVDDVVQETYLRAWRGFGRFRGESRVSTWITRIAINLTHRGTAQRRRMVPLSEQAGAALASRPGLSETALVRAYEQALGRLSPEQRAVFLMHEAEGLSYQAVAEALGCPLGTVMSRLHRARARLLEDLKEQIEERLP